MCPPDGELEGVDEEGVVEGGVVEDLDGVVEEGVVAEGVVEDLPWKRQLQYASYPLAVGGCLTICDPPPSFATFTSTYSPSPHSVSLPAATPPEHSFSSNGP